MLRLYTALLISTSISLLAGADVRLDEATLDAIDEVVPPGTLVDENDRGFSPWWLEASARRR